MLRISVGRGFRGGPARHFTSKEISGGPQTPKRDCLPEHLPSADGLEGVTDVLDSWRRRIVGPDDGHDVEAAALLQQTVPFEIVERGEGQPALLLGGHGLGRIAVTTCLDLDEDE